MKRVKFEGTPTLQTSDFRLQSYRGKMSSPFRVLFREFFGQFFASEAVTSDIRLRQSIIAVAAFLITPGLMLSGQLFPAYEFARLRAPELILPMTRMLATLFL